MYPCPCQICHLLGHAGNIHETLSESPSAEASGVICKTMDFNHLVFTMICNWKIIWLKIWGRKDLKWPLNGSLANGREAPVKITFITLLIRVCVCVCVYTCIWNIWILLSARIIHFQQLHAAVRTNQVSKTNLRLPKGKSGEGREKLGVWNEHIHTTIYKIDHQQRPTVYCRELYSVLCNNLCGERTWKEKKYAYV